MATPDAVLQVLLTILGLGIACNNTHSLTSLTPHTPLVGYAGVVVPGPLMTVDGWLLDRLRHRILRDIFRFPPPFPFDTQSIIHLSSHSFFLRAEMLDYSI